MNGPGLRPKFRHVFFQFRLARWVTWRALQLVGTLSRLFLSGRRKLFWLLALVEVAVFAWNVTRRRSHKVVWSHDGFGQGGLSRR